MNLLNTSISIAQVLLLGTAIFAACIGFRIIRNKARQKHKRSAPKPIWSARITDTVLLTLAGTLALAFYHNVYGFMGPLNTLPAEYAKVIVLMLVGGVIGVAAAATLALFGRTALAVMVLTAVICSYTFLNTSETVPGAVFVSQERLQASRRLTFQADNPSLRGAELWINDICLGRIPVTITRGEFKSKVPAWPQAMATNRIGTAKISEQAKHTPYRPDMDQRHPYGELILDHEMPGQSGMNNWTWPVIPFNRECKYWYRLKHGSEWSYVDGDHQQGNIISTTFDSVVKLPAAFPKRAERLERLLDIARLNDYQVDREWLAAIETFKDDGWHALRKAADASEMKKVLNTWATIRHGLHRAVDAESAWAVFDEICEEVDQRGQYNTADVTGQAVTLLAGKLDAGQLCDKAETLLDGKALYRLSYSHEFGGLQFKSEQLYQNCIPIDGSPMRGLAIAHAIWLIHQSQRDRWEKNETIIQQRIGPALARKDRLHLAVHIGGRQIEDFISRQGSDTQWPNRFYGMNNEDLNPWVLLIANLDSPIGRKFRREQKRVVLDTADQLTRVSLAADSLIVELDFLFLEPSLAQEYWPRFTEIVRDNPQNSSLALKWEYLSRMEPAPSVEDYVKSCDTASATSRAFSFGFDTLDSLPSAKRKAVFDGLIEHLQDEWDASRGDRAKLHRSIDEVREARACISHNSPAYLLKQLTSPDSTLEAKTVALWLEHTEPTSPLVGMLAEQEDPALRAMAIAPCRVHPTADHRTILTTLAADPDETVRVKAQAALADLAELAKIDPMSLADPPQ